MILFFLMRQALVRDYYATEILYYFLSILTISNMKTQNYKVIVVTEGYNFNIKCIFIGYHTKNDIIFQI